MPQKTRIHALFLTRWYPNRYDPMPGLFVERHAEAVGRHCDVSVLYLHADTDLKKGHEVVRETKNGVNNFRIYYPAVKNRVPFISESLKFLRFMLYMKKGVSHVRKVIGEPDILHVNILTRHGFVALIHKIIRGTPYIITEHWSRYLPATGTYKGFFRKLITKIVVRNASAVTAVTENLKNAMCSHGLTNDNYYVIPNVVDTDRFRISAASKKGEKKKIIHISCFEDRSKNISGILRVAGKLSAQRKDWELNLVGEGIDLDELRSFAKKLGIEGDFVNFDGLLENKDLVNSLQGSDFMVMFSNYENMPVVINESLACGIPVISSNVGGIAEVINRSNGILVDKGDESQLLESIKFLLDNFEKYDSQKLREFAVNNFSYEVVGKRIFNIYRDVLGRQ